MNDHERELLDRLLEAMGEVRAELKALNFHVQIQNGSIAKHLADDLTFQTALLARETIQNLASAKSQGFRAGFLWFIGIAASSGVGIGITIAKLALG